MSIFKHPHFIKLTIYTLNLGDECFIHQYVVDAYTAQNANEQSKNISLTFALVGLYLFLVKNYTGKHVQQFHTLMSLQKIAWPKLSLPINKVNLTIEYVLQAKTDLKIENAIKNWCTAVWQSFSQNHTKIEEITTYYLQKK